MNVTNDDRADWAEEVAEQFAAQHGPPYEGDDRILVVQDLITNLLHLVRRLHAGDRDYPTPREVVRGALRMYQDEVENPEG